MMLRAELAGGSYSKAEHNRALQPLLDGRSKSSVEFKHQNISAVLVGMGLPYIDGYKPAKNYQKAVLPQAVEGYLIHHPEFFDPLLSDGAVLSPIVAPVLGDRPVESIFEDRPEQIIVPPSEEKPWLSRKGRRIDFARRDAMNRHLGQLGEKFARRGREEAAALPTSGTTWRRRSSGSRRRAETGSGLTCCRSTRTTIPSSTSR